ncbi:MAG TPA: hypothetical protein VJH92_01540 [Candidatus Nanoarchaeia archaeon]|nr:hypothetical protein [Candidatus Nanoarchaeia archaeon]
MDPENIEILSQLISSLEKAELMLEEAYKKRNFDDFSKIKNFITQVQNKILENIK